MHRTLQFKMLTVLSIFFKKGKKRRTLSWRPDDRSRGCKFDANKVANVKKTRARIAEGLYYTLDLLLYKLVT